MAFNAARITWVRMEHISHAMYTHLNEQPGSRVSFNSAQIQTNGNKDEDAEEEWDDPKARNQNQLI